MPLWETRGVFFVAQSHGPRANPDAKAFAQKLHLQKGMAAFDLVFLALGPRLWALGKFSHSLSRFPC